MVYLLIKFIIIHSCRLFITISVRLTALMCMANRFIGLLFWCCCCLELAMVLKSFIYAHSSFFRIAIHDTNQKQLFNFFYTSLIIQICYRSIPSYFLSYMLIATMFLNNWLLLIIKVPFQYISIFLCWTAPPRISLLLYNLHYYVCCLLI